MRHDIHLNTTGMIVDRGYESEGDRSRSAVNNEPSNDMKQPICEEKSMKSVIMIWNVRGIGTTFKRFAKLLKNYRVDLLAISEVFMQEEALKCFATIFDYPYWCNNEHSVGKIWVMWKLPDDFHVVCMFDQMISRWSYIKGRKVLLSFVYAKCSYYKCRRLWSNLEEFFKNLSLWVAIGNFNCIWEDGERISGNPRVRVSIMEFNSCINSCELLDLRSKGGANVLVQQTYQAHLEIGIARYSPDKHPFHESIPVG